MKKFPDSRIRKLDPNGLIDKDLPLKDLELESFFLSLALIFNDIKGIVILENAINEIYEKPDQSISSHTGEWSGMRLQIVKYSASVLHEALNLIEKKKAILSKQSFQRYYNQLNSYDRNIWLLTLNVCGIEHSEKYDQTQISTFKKLLLLIRNNISFHYYDAGKPLIRGYRKFFFETPGPGSKSAMYSYQSTNFLGTRYYYADAALQGFINDEFAKLRSDGKALEEIYRMVIQIAKVIAGLLEVYHKDKKMN